MWGRPAPPPPPSADVPFTALVTTAILLLCAGGCVWITVRSRPVGTRAPLSVAEFFGMCASGDLAGVQAALNGSYQSKPSNTGGGRRPYALALAINVVAVAIDGRFDSENLLDSEGQMTMLPWPTLLSPAGFAFAIWGLIYVGELAGLAVVLRTGGADDVGGAAIMRVVRASNTAWLSANCAQARLGLALGFGLGFGLG